MTKHRREVEELSPFESLATALDGWFDQLMENLPEAQRRRVMMDFFPMPWDQLSPDQRRSVAAQWDYQSDPAMKSDRQYWWGFYETKVKLKGQIEKWSAIATPTATDLAQKEARLAELQRELAAMEKSEQQVWKEIPDRRPPSNKGNNPGADQFTSRPEYIAYPKAMKLLASSLDATPEEMAAWLFYGPEQGGLAAYMNANELEEPPRFYFVPGTDDANYLDPLMGCWFVAKEIADFQPADRYITGAALIERWQGQPGIQPKPYILAKIKESRLLD